MNYSNLEGEVGNINAWVVSVVGDRIGDDVGVPGCEVWFLVSFHLGAVRVQVRCLTQDGVCFRPIEWTDYVDGFGGGFKFVGDSVGGGGVWAAVGDCVREFIGRGGDDEY